MRRLMIITSVSIDDKLTEPRYMLRREHPEQEAACEQHRPRHGGEPDQGDHVHSPARVHPQGADKSPHLCMTHILPFPGAAHYRGLGLQSMFWVVDEESET